MNFDKKYWSTDEYVTEENKPFSGFVGIKDGKAYDFTTSKLLNKIGTYGGIINAQDKNFDRILSKELKLPYNKEDISFAANDFLYPSILKTSIKRLQDNNDYLFRNAIISNSVIPYTNNCILLTSTEGSTGKLYKYDFSTSAFETKTSLDPTFYPQTEEYSRYFVYNKFGNKLEKLDKDTHFIKSDKTYASYPDSGSNTQDYLKQLWCKLNKVEDPSKINDNAHKITEDEIMGSDYENLYGTTKNDLEEIEVTSGTFLGDYKEITVSANTNFNVKIASELLKNLCINKDYENTINFRFYEVELLIKGNVPSKLSIGNISSSGYKKFRIDDLYTHVVYEFSSSTFNIKSVFSGDENFNFKNFKLNGSTVLCGFPEEGNTVKSIIKYKVGNIENKLEQYPTIPNIKREVEYSFVWSAKKSKTSNEREEHIAEPNISYKFLIESFEWLNAEDPKLELMDSTYNETNPYTPNDNMSAQDVYNYMLNKPATYRYPQIYRHKISYKRLGEITNSRFKEIIYPITSYQFEVDEDNNSTVVQGYKDIESLHAYLKTKSGNIYKFTEYANRYDKVPNVVEERFIGTSGKEPIHNFNEIVASEIIARDFNENEKSCNLIIFLLFKTKLLIFKTKYFYDGGSEQNVIHNVNDVKNPDLYIDLSSKDKKYIEINTIDPRDETSLKFLNLNAIKIYKNKLYLIDNKLDMVLRYSIDYLVDELELIDTAFNSNSVVLSDVLQGLGDSTDKIYFKNPYSIDICDDKLYIADRGNNCVKSYTSALNYRKTIKNGFFSQHDIQAVAINPFPCKINEIDIAGNSLWIASVLGNRMFLSVLEDDIVKVYGQIEDISLLQDEYSWLEEIRGIHFSQTHSNYFYLTTTKRVYKFHVSQPFYPFASLSYFKQRSLVGTMRWSAMRFPWHNVPSAYNITTIGNTEAKKDQLTWDYILPSSSAEILDNKCFCLTGNNRVEGDIIFHYGILYDESKIRDYIKRNKVNFNGKMTFYDIDSGNLASMIKSAAMLFYSEPSSYISTISNINMKPYDIYHIEDSLSEDYINALSINKILYAVTYNLLLIKNALIGYFRAATNLDNVIVYDNLVMDNYFNALQIGAEEDYFVHENEHLSILINRSLENIYDLQEKILEKMQTEFMAAQSFVNNTSRII